MRRRSVGILLSVVASIGLVCASDSQPPNGQAQRELTLLYTNDFESAYDPIPAYWRDDVDRVGGIAQLAALIEQERRRAPTSFLLATSSPALWQSSPEASCPSNS